MEIRWRIAERARVCPCERRTYLVFLFLLRRSLSSPSRPSRPGSSFRLPPSVMNAWGKLEIRNYRLPSHAQQHTVIQQLRRVSLSQFVDEGIPQEFRALRVPEKRKITERKREFVSASLGAHSRVGSRALHGTLHGTLHGARVSRDTARSRSSGRKSPPPEM